MPNYNVYLEGAWLVKDVATGEDAIGIAISEAGKRLNPKLEFVGVDVGTMSCANCDEEFMSVYVVADTALVGLLFQMKVYEAESEEHAARIATSVIGKALRDVPLKVAEIDEFVSDSRPQKPGQNAPRRDRNARSEGEGGRDRGKRDFGDRRESDSRREPDSRRESENKRKFEDDDDDESE
ncbi:hypothetical protein MmiAt1_00630 [Methanimicrococcus sp. At1]|uniref:UPF0212 protein MmiAt1_00630 n=1 Tax=Methanimicrococcus hacksteinii TaxID=3028293 RepID=A0ABU3VMB0_9EURY|nr:DUF555 domain-containing protein [Methanimicrococcus sp. At1]MDV0444537.1 hypothetical protein [Methanimicrococcus sp. At1]